MLVCIKHGKIFLTNDVTKITSVNSLQWDDIIKVATTKATTMTSKNMKINQTTWNTIDIRSFVRKRHTLSFKQLITTSNIETIVSDALLVCMNAAHQVQVYLWKPNQARENSENGTKGSVLFFICHNLGWEVFHILMLINCHPSHVRLSNKYLAAEDWNMALYVCTSRYTNMARCIKMVRIWKWERRNTRNV